MQKKNITEEIRKVETALMFTLDNGNLASSDKLKLW